LQELLNETNTRYKYEGVSFKGMPFILRCNGYYLLPYTWHPIGMAKAYIGT